MRDLRYICYFDVNKAYATLRKYGYAPQFDHYAFIGLTLEKKCHVIAVILESLTDEQLKSVPHWIEQLYNYIFLDEAEGPRRGYEASFKTLTQLSMFGHKEGTQAYIIDEMIKKGGFSRFEIACAINSSEQRVDNHIKDVRKKFPEYEIMSVKKKTKGICYYVKERKLNEQLKKGNDGKYSKGFIRKSVSI